LTAGKSEDRGREMGEGRRWGYRVGGKMEVVGGREAKRVKRGG